MEKENSTQKIAIQGRDLIKELGLEKLSERGQVKLIEDMTNVFWKRLLLRLVDRISEEEAEELNNYLRNKEYENADRYLAEKIPDFPSILQEEIDKFGEEIIKRTKE